VQKELLGKIEEMSSDSEPQSDHLTDNENNNVLVDNAQ